MIFDAVDHCIFQTYATRVSDIDCLSFANSWVMKSSRFASDLRGSVDKSNAMTGLQSWLAMFVVKSAAISALHTRIK